LPTVFVIWWCVWRGLKRSGRKLEIWVQGGLFGEAQFFSSIGSFADLFSAYLLD
jgi:hypothetical protein